MTSDMQGSAEAGSPARGAPFLGWGPLHTYYPPGPLMTHYAADAGMEHSLCIDSALSYSTEKHYDGGHNTQEAAR